MSPTRRIAGLLTGTLISTTMLTGLVFTTPATAADTQGLATCKAHHANTVAWADCVGGTEKSWVRVAAKCWSGWKHSDWVRVDPGKKKTVRYECWRSVSDAKAQIRKY